MGTDLTEELKTTAQVDHRHLGWLFPLASVLSVTTGRVLTGPWGITELLSYMFGEPIDFDTAFDTDLTLNVARECSGSLLEQHPRLVDVEPPPFPKDPGSAVHTAIPAEILMYVARVAVTLPEKSVVEAANGDVLVLVRPLTSLELDRIGDGTQPSE